MQLFAVIAVQGASSSTPARTSLPAGQRRQLHGPEWHTSTAMMAAPAWRLYRTSDVLHNAMPHQQSEALVALSIMWIWCGCIGPCKE
jgi:hypothetical protein